MKAVKPSAEIPLEKWAESKDVSIRTAREWAKNKKITAKKRRTKVRVVQEKTVTKYFVKAKTPVPKVSS